MSRNLLSSILLLCFVFVNTVVFAQDQKAKDEHILADYFAAHHIKATRTASGLYYTINKKGAGENAKPGQQVNMNYLGRFLDGKTFDGNIDADFKPVPGRSVLSFTLGTGRVIAGWDEGIKLLNPGCRATLYIPSSLGYGERGNGPIPPNTVMMFDVELVSVSN